MPALTIECCVVTAAVFHIANITEYKQATIILQYGSLSRKFNSDWLSVRYAPSLD